MGGKVVIVLLPLESLLWLWLLKLLSTGKHLPGRGCWRDCRCWVHPRAGSSTWAEGTVCFPSAQWSHCLPDLGSASIPLSASRALLALSHPKAVGDPPVAV